MRVSRFLLVLLGCLAALWAVASADDNAGRIYGTIYTVDGEEFEGLIRWDKNEANWVDVLDGTKELDSRRRKHKSWRREYRDRKPNIRIFGINIVDYDDHGYVYSSWGSSAMSGIRFGHIKVMEVIDDDRALLTLKSGEEVELSGNSTDIGSGIREIVIEDRREGEVELSWDDVERIEFMEAKTSERSNYGERLYGTLTTRRGQEFTGFVCWDVDELFTTDILDGDQKRRSRKIKFGRIVSIERYSSSGAEVVLESGDEMVLRGTNDVDDDNRGIIISVPSFGQVKVDWDEFDKLVFSEPPRQVTYKEFDGGRPLRGTVYTEDGEEYSGRIRWDDDEEYTWELLNGDYRDVEFEIEFGLIKEIERTSSRSSTVTIWDGREFRLRGSNDVDNDNRGIIITLDDDDEVYIDWEDFSRVEFAKR